MLIIPYYIARSEIHGMGVFSAIDLRCGDPVWRYDPQRDLIVTLDDFSNLSSRRKDDVMNHAQWYPDQEHFVLGSDGDYFMNHANEPTLSDYGDTMVAAQHLLRGSELTCDYRVVPVLGFPLFQRSASAFERHMT